VALDDLGHLDFLELRLETGPHPLDRVVLGPVGYIEDAFVLVVLEELGGLFDMMHSIVVEEKDECLGLACLQQC
jgi:hypothetical protein